MGEEYHFCPAYDSLHMGDNNDPLAPGQHYSPEPRETTPAPSAPTQVV
jgi:hypothetical protein